jgi:hypothetical protein
MKIYFIQHKLIITGVVLITILAVVFGIRFLSGEDNWICENGQWTRHGNPNSLMPTTSCDNNLKDYKELPKGYTLDSYEIKEVLNNSCEENLECTTPGKYLIQSNCPYTSLCIKNKCTVVCPDHTQNSQETSQL